MQFLPAQLSYFVETTAMRRNLSLLLRFIAILVVMIAQAVRCVASGGSLRA